MKETLAPQFSPQIITTAPRNSVFPVQWHVLGNQYVAIETASVPSLAGSSTYTRIAPVGAFAMAMSEASEERKVLREAVTNLWHIYRYNQHYIGFLNGGVSNEDFNAAAELYVREPRDYDMKRLQFATRILLPIIGDDELTSRDIAAVLNVRPAQLELVFSSGER